MNELIKAAYENSKAHGFWEGVDPVKSIPEKLMLMVSELSEALEHYRNGYSATEIWPTNGKPDGFPVELADTVIRIADLCGALGIDLDEAIKRKMEYNISRPYKHGKTC